MSDKTAEELLRDWGLEAYICNFKEHEVQKELFPLLDKDQLAVLFKGKLGSILKFQQNVHLLEQQHHMFRHSDVTCNSDSERLWAGSSGQWECKTEDVDLGIHHLPDDKTHVVHIMEQDLAAKYQAGPSHPHNSEYDCTASPDFETSIPWKVSPNTHISSKRAHSKTLTPPGSAITVAQKRGSTPSNTTNVVEAYLQSSLLGRASLHGFRHGKPLNQSTRVKICNEVILAELSNNPEHSISSRRFDFLAKSISNLFEGEVQSLYYIPRVPGLGKQRAVQPKGMLYDKYHNILKYLRQNLFRGSNRQGCNKADSSDSEDDYNCDPFCAESIEWLEQHSSQSWVLIKSKWNATAAYRINSLQKSIDGTSKCKIGGDMIHLYMKRFPCLSLGCGLDLLADDFDYLHKGKSKLFVENWHQISRKVINATKRNKDTFPEETVKWLQLIPTLFRQPVIAASRKDNCREQKRRLWRPSVKESTEAFMLHVKETADLEKKVSLMRQKCEEVQKTLLPFPAVVGPTVCDILESYIIVGDVYFRVESPLVAFDKCFKLYHALHSHYPYQSSYAWLFVQRAIYDITTKWDMNIPAVDANVDAFQKVIL